MTDSADVRMQRDGSACLQPAPEPDPQRFERLQSWVRMRGATLAPMALTTGPEGRVLCATEPIRAGQLVLHLPLAAMIRERDARASETGRLLRERGVRLSAYGFLAVALLDLARTAGEEHPLLGILPASMADHPYCWPEADLVHLQGSFVLPMLRRRRVRIAQEHARLVAAIAPVWPLSLEDYLRAACLAWTRAFTIRVDGEDTYAMLPVADLLDHSTQPNVEWIKESSLGFVMTAMRDIEAGEPLTHRYWSKSNARMLATFGFCVADNPNEVAELRLPDLPADHPCAGLAADLGAADHGVRVFQVAGDPDARSTRELLTWLRLAECGRAESVPLRNGRPDPRATGWADEGAVLRRLAEACRLRLREFPGTLEEDAQLLLDRSLPSRVRAAVLARYGEKSVLRNLLHFAEAGLSGRENHDS